ncbi:MAG: ABC transporter permease, partial [Pirellulaceae bacterium]
MLQRIWQIAWHDFITYLRRPMVWVWIILLALVYWGMSAGNVQIAVGGDSTIGGTKQHLNSEFELSRLMAAMMMIIHGFFATVLFGLAVIRDHDTGIMPLLHSSRLTPAEYLIGKFLGCTLLVLTVLAINVLLLASFMSVFPDQTRADYFGPFSLKNFVFPTLKFILPAMMFLAGAAFVLGTLTRKPVLVFAFPLIFLLVFGLFLNSWSPLWLPTWANNMLCLADPYGTRWLNETYFNVDRGAEFYNTQPVKLGTAFLISRFAIIAAGLLGLAITVPLFRRRLRGSKHGSLSAIDQANTKHAGMAKTASGELRSLAAMQMKQQGNGLLHDTWNILRYELKELRHSPSLYLFVPFIIIEVIGTSFFREGAFGTPLLHTSGSLAEGALTVLAILGCLLMMFFTVESQMRERIKKLAPIYYSTPARSFAMLFGKSLANTAVCVVIMAAALVASLIILLIQGVVSFEIFPFTAYWLFLLMPTFIVWGAFITFIIVLTRNRYTTYGVAAAVLIGTLYLNLSGNLTWFSNWMLTGAAPWSDIAVFEMDRPALWLNRLFALSLAILFTYLAARIFWRRGLDAVQMATRFKPKAIGKFGLKAIPFLILPFVFGSMLWSQVNQGYQGKIVEDLEKKYWQQNYATWAKTKPPAVSGVDIKLDIEPDQQSLQVEGTLRLTNDREESISRFALTTGTHWKDVAWRLGDTFTTDEQTPGFPDGSELPDYEPENRSGLYFFSFDPPIGPGESTTLAYTFHGRYPDGISKVGGGTVEFILPSGVVMTSFGTAFIPAPGFSDTTGLDDDYQPESKEYEDDFYEEQLKPLFGGGDRFHVRTTITGPEDFTFNGVGIKQDDRTSAGRRTVIWESDSPVSFFNVVGGRWKVHKGEQSEIYYDIKHDYNVDEISEAIDAARAWYSR